MQKVNWNFKNSSLDPQEIVRFSKENSLSYVMASVLLNRGINSREQLKNYIGKSLDCINNPMLFPDMEKAVEKIISQIPTQEKITIYGDYDVDGVTATALLYSFLKENGLCVDYFIPDRFSDGYGLNVLTINKLKKNGTKLLITVDCGISSIGEVELANALGIDVIITDHHSLKEKLPNAFAVINPKREDSEYPFTMLAGVGVAFKLVLALSMKLGLNTKDTFDKYVELACLGTIADVVSLKGENRVIADRGIKSLSNCKNPGIKALLEICGANNKKVDSTTVAFLLSPRINAAGRMEDAKIAVDLLLSDSSDSAYLLAVKLDEINKKRQAKEQEIFRVAVDMIENDPQKDEKKIFVLACEGWHHGVIGIVASRLVEMYYKPCILISYEGKKAKGSGRSVDGVNLFDALLSCEDILTQFGGHSQAAGLSLDIDSLDELSKRLNDFILKNHKGDFVKTLDIDCSVPTSFITLQSAKQLEFLEPFGEGNEKPVFALHQTKVLSASTMGMDNKHLRLNIDANGKTFEAVGFNFGSYEKFLTPGKLVDIAFNLDINSFRGKEKVQLIIKDIKNSEI